MQGLRVSVQDVESAQKEGQRIVFLDVRSPQAWASGETQIPGSIRMPLTDFDAHADELPRDAELVAYCT